MATQPLQYNNFIAGLVTDFSDVNFPENALSESVNMEVSVDGSIRRRRGLGKISDKLLDAEPETVTILEAFSASNGSNNYLCVVWESGKVVLYDSDNDYSVVGEFSFKDYNTVSNLNYTVNAKGIFFSTYGDFVDGTKRTGLYYLEFTSEGLGESIKSYSLMTRDLKGIKDSEAESDVRPTTLTTAHKYNLQNQGWFKTVKKYTDGTEVLDVDYFHEATGVYPSLSDNPNLGLTVNPSESDEQRFRPETIIEFAYSDLSITSRGSVKYNPLDPSPGASPSNSSASKYSQQEIVDILRANGKIKSDAGEISGIEGYSSRVFYTGFQNHPALKGVVFYSKILESIEDAGICYQEADPSSSTAPDPLEIDGGYISIPEAGDIITIKTINKYLYVFASNGTWVIYGDPTAGGFSNLNYVVAKVSDVPVYSKRAIDSVVGSVIFVGAGGIYTLMEDKTSGMPVINSIIKDKLSNWFRGLSKQEKENSVVKFDKENGKLYFIFNKTRVLVLILDTGTFFEYELKAPIDFVVPMTYMKMYEVTSSNNGYPIPYVVEHIPYSIYFISGNTLCYFVNTGYYDVDEGTGAYDSYMSIGPYNFKELYRKKQAVRFITQMKRTETVSHEDSNGDIVLEDESSCLLQPVWDYSSSPITGKEGNWMQVYAPPRFVSFEPTDTYGYTVHQTKRKLRGSGKALKLNFKSVGNKHMDLLGYAIELTTRSRG